MIEQGANLLDELSGSTAPIIRYEGDPSLSRKLAKELRDNFEI